MAKTNKKVGNSKDRTLTFSLDELELLLYFFFAGIHRFLPSVRGLTILNDREFPPVTIIFIQLLTIDHSFLKQHPKH